MKEMPNDNQRFECPGFLHEPGCPKAAVMLASLEVATILWLCLSWGPFQAILAAVLLLLFLLALWYHVTDTARDRHISQKHNFHCTVCGQLLKPRKYSPDRCSQCGGFYCHTCRVFETWPDAIIRRQIENKMEAQREKWRNITKREKKTHAEPGASPNGGSAEPLTKPGVYGGPPSVS